MTHRRCGVWAALLASCTAVQEILFDERSHVAVCLTAKVANSEISDYVRWTRVGPPHVCQWRPSYVIDYSKACEHYTCAPRHARALAADTSGSHKTKHAKDAGKCDRLRRPEAAPLHTCEYDAAGALVGGCERLRAPYRLLVPLRDPYTKLLSAFHSKHTGVCKSDDACFRRQFLPSFSTDKADGPALLRYLDAVSAALLAKERPAKPGQASLAKLNYHFRLQADQCLSPAMTETARRRGVARVPVPLDRGGDGLNLIGAALGATGNRSFSTVMSGAYGFATACYSPRELKLSMSSALLIDKMARALRPDYVALRQQFGIAYESEAALARAARSSHVRICTTYGLFVRNKSDEEWATLHAHSSSTSNMPNGDTHALCCEKEPPAG